MTQQVFISYSNENQNDRQVADRIYDTLKAREIPCWVAHRDIAAGQNWPDEISKAISNSRIMIVVLSGKTQESRYVRREVTQAADENITIIPFCIERVSLSGGLKLLLSDCQWINAHLMRQDKALDRLVENLGSYLGIEPGKTFKKEEKQLDVDIQIKAPKPIEKKETAPDFISDLKSKGWDVKRNENDCWEAFYEDYDVTMIHIPPGKFLMGANAGNENEKPLHQVDLDGYWIGKFEVTFAQYDRYCRETGKEKPGDRGWGRENRPVINVSWDDAAAYCQWLSQEIGITFQMPTEAQWEKAARGSRGFKYPWGNDFDKNKCNSIESGLEKTMPVGSYPSGKSPYGCMDMAGNVYEWCADWYNKAYYKKSPAKNPQGPAGGSDRVLRGGGWFSGTLGCRAAYRYVYCPANRYADVGFRLLMLL